ncbi:unnamed protein product [Wuchereria bancrofti]|uniref:Uncharacterized protein n=1 Tax=Wuchereria bancrofti TaxID=6293 RepID=A0A3P7GFE1_WUCBA|nr:unnamed protein product [Wuchereria bancrofti]
MKRECLSGVTTTQRKECGGGGQGGGGDRRHLPDCGKGERKIKDEEEEDTCQTVREVKHRDLNIGWLVEVAKWPGPYPLHSHTSTIYVRVRTCPSVYPMQDTTNTMHSQVRTAFS